MRMIFSKKTTLLMLSCVLTALCVNSCKRFQGEVEVPAYLHLDRIDIAPQSQNAPSSEAGFYTSLIDAAQVICHFKGDPAETTLGVFQLPFTIPVLYQGAIEYVIIVPVVKQNGIAGTRIAYPYYQTIKLENVVVAADSITNLGSFDKDNNQWTLKGHYFPLSRMKVLVEDYFEPTAFSSIFDSNMTWVHDDPQGARTGQGYGCVTVPDSVLSYTFSIPANLSPAVTDMLYLEMDYHTDLELYLNMLGFPGSSTGSLMSKAIMGLYPNTQWQKIYINLGRTWSQFSYNTPIPIFFQVANPDKKGGKVYLDNVKIITI